jgi:hypothetical protein
MNSKDQRDFWSAHLSSVDGGLMHFVPSQLLSLEELKTASLQLNFSSHTIDCRLADSLSGLVGQIGSALHFPKRSGGNLDQAFDMLTDLSWAATSGYVLVFLRADALLSFPQSELHALFDLAQGTIRNWRDERGEHGERNGPTPFHFIFSDGDHFRDAIFKVTKEPLCTHHSHATAQVRRAPGGIEETEIFRDAKKLLHGGAELEGILSLFRERDLGTHDWIYMVAGLMDMPIPHAKQLVEGTQYWLTYQREREAKTRDAAREALENLGFEDA